MDAVVVYLFQDFADIVQKNQTDVAQVPEGLDPNEWLALHSKAFFFSMSRCKKTNTIEMYIVEIHIQLRCTHPNTIDL